MSKLWSSEHSKSSVVNHLFFGLLIACMLLDLFDMWSVTRAPEVLANFSCSIRPYVSSLASLMFSDKLVEFARDQCRQNQPKEPTFSIIFFMAKWFLSLASILVLWLLILLSPQTFQETKEKLFNRYREDGGIYLWSDRATSVAIGLILFSFYWFLHLTLSKEPKEFYLDLLHKFF